MNNLQARAANAPNRMNALAARSGMNALQRRAQRKIEEKTEQGETEQGNNNNNFQLPKEEREKEYLKSVEYRKGEDRKEYGKYNPVEYKLDSEGNIQEIKVYEIIRTHKDDSGRDYQPYIKQEYKRLEDGSYEITDYSRRNREIKRESRIITAPKKTVSTQIKPMAGKTLYEINVDGKIYQSTNEQWLNEKGKTLAEEKKEPDKEQGALLYKDYSTKEILSPKNYTPDNQTYTPNIMMTEDPKITSVIQPVGTSNVPQRGADYEYERKPEVTTTRVEQTSTDRNNNILRDRDSINNRIVHSIITFALKKNPSELQKELIEKDQNASQAFKQWINSVPPRLRYHIERTPERIEEAQEFFKLYMKRILTNLDESTGTGRGMPRPLRYISGSPQLGGLAAGGLSRSIFHVATGREGELYEDIGKWDSEKPTKTEMAVGAVVGGAEAAATGAGLGALFQGTKIVGVKATAAAMNKIVQKGGISALKNMGLYLAKGTANVAGKTVQGYFIYTSAEEAAKAVTQATTGQRLSAARTVGGITGGFLGFYTGERIMRRVVPLRMEIREPEMNIAREPVDSQLRHYNRKKTEVSRTGLITKEGEFQVRKDVYDEGKLGKEGVFVRLGDSSTKEKSIPMRVTFGGKDKFSQMIKKNYLEMRQQGNNKVQSLKKAIQNMPLPERVLWLSTIKGNTLRGSLSKKQIKRLQHSWAENRRFTKEEERMLKKQLNKHAISEKQIERLGADELEAQVPVSLGGRDTRFVLSKDQKGNIGIIAEHKKSLAPRTRRELNKRIDQWTDDYVKDRIKRHRVDKMNLAGPKEHGTEHALAVQKEIKKIIKEHPELKFSKSEETAAEAAGYLHDIAKRGEASGKKVEFPREHGDAMARLIEQGKYKSWNMPIHWKKALSKHQKEVANAIRNHDRGGFFYHPNKAGYKALDFVGRKNKIGKVLETADRLQLSRYGIEVRPELLPIKNKRIVDTINKTNKKKSNSKELVLERKKGGVERYLRESVRDGRTPPRIRRESRRDENRRRNESISEIITGHPPYRRDFNRGRNIRNDRTRKNAREIRAAGRAYESRANRGVYTYENPKRIITIPPKENNKEEKIEFNNKENKKMVYGYVPIVRKGRKEIIGEPYMSEKEARVAGMEQTTIHNGDEFYIKKVAVEPEKLKKTVQTYKQKNTFKKTNKETIKKNKPKITNFDKKKKINGNFNWQAMLTSK